MSLARALGVSHTPVREALGALQREGLIAVRPQAGSDALLPSEEDVAKLAEFRRVLEVTALRATSWPLHAQIPVFAMPW